MTNITKAKLAYILLAIATMNLAIAEANPQDRDQDNLVTKLSYSNPKDTSKNNDPLKPWRDAFENAKPLNLSELGNNHFCLAKENGTSLQNSSYGLICFDLTGLVPKAFSGFGDNLNNLSHIPMFTLEQGQFEERKTIDSYYHNMTFVPAGVSSVERAVFRRSGDYIIVRMDQIMKKFEDGSYCNHWPCVALDGTYYETLYLAASLITDRQK